LWAGRGRGENDQPGAADLRCHPCAADQVLRNDIRVIAAGNGCTDDLQLEHLPANTDIRVGDVLVTSGLGGRFPEGYPVGVVSSVKLDTQRAYT
jgi:rod shape-determining protein MreC